MDKEDYRKRAELLAYLLYLAIKEGDFSKVEEYQRGIQQAIEDMRKKPS